MTGRLRAQDCNLVLYTAAGSPVFQSGTYGAGTNPCRAVMQNNGLLTIFDATNRAVSSMGTTGPAYPTTGVLLSGQQLSLVTPPSHPSVLCAAVWAQGAALHMHAL